MSYLMNTLSIPRHRVLQQSAGLENQGHVVWQLALLLLFAWLLVYFALFKGVKWTGKVSQH